MGEICDVRLADRVLLAPDVSMPPKHRLDGKVKKREGGGGRRETRDLRTPLRASASDARDRLGWTARAGGGGGGGQRMPGLAVKLVFWRVE